MLAVSNSSIENVLEQFDGYIVSLAWKSIPMSIFQTGILDLEVDELIQRVRIKLWQALKRQHIEHVRAYIRFIIHSEVVDMFRRHKPALPLPIDEDGEFNQEKAKAVGLEYHEGIQDPLYEIEQEEEFDECVEKVTEAVCKLPPRQNYALLCTLKDKVEDCFQVMAALKERGYDIDGVKWPEKARDKLRLKASLSASRKKLREIIEILP